MKRMMSFPHAIGIAVATGVFLVDRVLKVQINAGRLRGSLGIVQFIPLHNYGAMGSSFLHHRLLLTTVGLVVIAGLVTLWVRYRPQKHRLLYAVGWGMLFGGALGNTFDRVVFGYVTDMFHLPGGNGVFNAADVSLQVGTVLMVLHALLPAFSGSRQPHLRD